MRSGITGLTRVRNEELIIEDTLEHFFNFCDHIYVYDDASTDRTREIASRFKNVILISGAHWEKDREIEETRHRQLLLHTAKSEGAKWCLYFDADERIVGHLPKASDIPEYISAFRFKLFDGYMTPECNEDYKAGELISVPRMWGPEMRAIAMLFRADRAEFIGLDQREPVIMMTNYIPVVRQSSVAVKHFGKCISKSQYFETCDYYEHHFPKYSEKWAKRREIGHMRTDGTSHFGYPLYEWDELVKLQEYPHTP